MQLSYVRKIISLRSGIQVFGNHPQKWSSLWKLVVLARLPLEIVNFKFLLLGTLYYSNGGNTGFVNS